MRRVDMKYFAQNGQWEGDGYYETEVDLSDGPRIMTEVTLKRDFDELPNLFGQPYQCDLIILVSAPDFGAPALLMPRKER